MGWGENDVWGRVGWKLGRVEHVGGVGTGCK